MLAENGYTEPYETEPEVWNVIVTLETETPAHNCLTLAVAGKKKGEDQYRCVIFGTQKGDDFAALSVKFEYKSEEDKFAEITKADWDFFQGATVEDLGADIKIIGFINVNNNKMQTLVGEKAIEI